MDIDLKAGSIQDELFRRLEKLIVPGESIYHIIDFIDNFLSMDEVYSIPGSTKTTININNIVYHGLPGEKFLEHDDIITIDVCFKYKTAIIDGAKTFLVGKCSENKKRVVKINRDLVLEALGVIKAGVSVFEIVRFFNDYVLVNGLYLFKDGAGHGIGSELHQRPYISLSDMSDGEYLFKPGDKFTIEPIVLFKEEEVETNIIGEGYISSENFSSQFEITIILDECGEPVVLNPGLLK